MAYFNVFLDLVLIGLLIAGIRYAMRLTRQLADMREGRVEMERFIIQFNSTVNRAEAGVSGLKQAARSTGDDLEKLIEKGHLLRDELTFLTESADMIANRLSASASQASRTPAPQPETKAPAKAQMPDAAVTQKSAQALAQEMKSMMGVSGKTPSSAERELIRALEKLG
jgi:hypothetical protein